MKDDVNSELAKLRFVVRGQSKNHGQHLHHSAIAVAHRKAWGYVNHDVMAGVVLPAQKRVQRFFLSDAEIRRILRSEFCVVMNDVVKDYVYSDP